MNPHLRYSQAIRGRVTGRGIGIIDTLHLVEVARATEVLGDSPALSASERSAVRAWFSDYLDWMTTHPYGIEEREAKNNHGTCWALQVAAFARLTGEKGSPRRVPDALQDRARAEPDGGRRQLPPGAPPHQALRLFPLQPRSAGRVAQSLSTPEDDLWRFELADGRGLRKAMEYMVPVHP